MRRPQVPVALRWVVAAALLVGTAWALLVPAWQAPDEDAHFAYVQTLVELHRRPADDGRRAVEAAKSTEQDRAELASGFTDASQRIEEKPTWDPRVEARWDRDEAALPAGARDDGGGLGRAGGNPAGYYLYAAVPYLATRSADIFTRLYLMRVWSVLLLAVLATSGWLLAGELVGRDRGAQMLAAAVCGLAPMATFVSATVSPDALVYPLWGLAFWLAVRLVRHGRRRADVIGIVVVMLVALAVKPVSVALLPGVLWALLWRRIPLRLVLGALVVTALVAALVVPGGPRRFASYLWQFYVPFDAGTNVLPQLAPWPLRDTWLEGTVGAFGWLEVRLPWWFYAGAAMLGLAVLVAALRRVDLRRDTHILLVFVLPAIALLAGLHLTEAWFLVRERSGFTQGRYLLPLLPLVGATVAVAYAGLPARARGVAAGAALGLLVVAQVASLAAVAGRFYA
jgi:4-amino-4-deoxy-L-arabinose transferase-like glycosyltransferase